MFDLVEGGIAGVRHAGPASTGTCQAVQRQAYTRTNPLPD